MEDLKDDSWGGNNLKRAKVSDDFPAPVRPTIPGNQIFLSFLFLFFSSFVFLFVLLFDEIEITKFLPAVVLNKRSLPLCLCLSKFLS